tara:strand:+ start:918 stop:1943 length:1026 start_codon:yes stop_codon:yes gene_type:complete
MNKLSESVIDFCSDIGGDAFLVQGAGGNVSWKDDDTLWIKASGTWLSEAKHKEIFLPVDLAHLRSSIDDGDFSVTPMLIKRSKLKPSIETLLHALMPHKIVVHLHAVEILAHLVRSDFHETFNRLLGDKVSWCYVDYFKPGLELARAVHLELSLKPNVEVVFLRNHGVVIGGNTVDDIYIILKTLNDSLKTPVNATLTLLPSTNEVLSFPQLSELQYHLADDPQLHALAKIPELISMVKKSWAMFPDHVVFLGPQSVCGGFNDVLTLLTTNKTVRPPFIFVEQVGVFQHQLNTRAQADQLNCYYEVLVRQTTAGYLTILEEHDINALMNWDAEKYRQTLSK